jgi:hypothetical protein
MMLPRTAAENATEDDCGVKAAAAVELQRSSSGRHDASLECILLRVETAAMFCLSVLRHEVG